MSDNTTEDQPSRWLAVIEATSISPADARSYVEAIRKKMAHISDKKDLSDAVSKEIIKRYCKMSALSGALTAAPGVLPGVGTAVAVVGGGLVDVTASMKFQVDMCRCLSINYGYDLDNESAKYLSMIVAFSGAVEKLSGTVATRIGSKAGVTMVKTYLRGATLTALKSLLAKIGIRMTRKSIEKAIPFGVGVVIGSSINYGMTSYVGHEAVKFFSLSSKSDFDF